MPNSANRKAGNNKGTVGHKEEVNKKRETANPNPERSDLTKGSPERGRRDDTSRTSNQGRKEASGGEVEE